MTKRGLDKLSLVSFLCVPLILAVSQHQLGSITSLILMVTALYFALRYEKFFSSRFGVIKLKEKYIVLVALAFVYIVISNYFDSLRLIYLFVFAIASYGIMDFDIKRMDKAK